jgi:SAM-dependent methyltransferase
MLLTNTMPTGWLVCPSCRAELSIGNEALYCPACKARYPIRDGVIEIAQCEDTVGDKAAKTVRQFGSSWQIHSHVDEYHEKQILDWISPLRAEDFHGKSVLEAGCGKGRHSRTVAKWGPKVLFSVDLSSAVYLAARNTEAYSNAFCIKADLLNLPFANEKFDLIFCVGVLHHLADPRAGLKEMWSRLKPGGTLCLWVYAREGNGWVVWLVDPIRKGFTSRIPTRLLRPIVWPLSAFLFMVLKTIYAPLTRKGERTVNFLPYSAYLGYISKFPFREIDSIVLDHLCPPIAYYLKKETLQKWLDGLGAKDVRFRWHNKNSWNVVATKR